MQILRTVSFVYTDRMEYVELTGKETSLEDTQDKTKRKQCVPLLHKSEANHDRSPDNNNGRQENAGTKLAEDNGGRRLQSNVCNEEQEHNETVSFAGELQINTHTSNHGNTKVGSVHETIWS